MDRERCMLLQKRASELDPQGLYLTEDPKGLSPDAGGEVV